MRPRPLTGAFVIAWVVTASITTGCEDACDDQASSTYGCAEYVPVLYASEALLVDDFDDCLTDGWRNRLGHTIGISQLGNGPPDAGPGMPLPMTCDAREERGTVAAVPSPESGRTTVQCACCSMSPGACKDALRRTGNAIRIDFNVSGARDAHAGRIFPLFSPGTSPTRDPLSCRAGFDASGFAAVAFWMRTDTPATNVEVAIMDAWQCLTAEKRLALDHVEGSADGWRRVVVPLTSTLEGFINDGRPSPPPKEPCTVDLRSLLHIELTFGRARFKLDSQNQGRQGMPYPVSGRVYVDELALLLPSAPSPVPRDGSCPLPPPDAGADGRAADTDPR